MKPKELYSGPAPAAMSQMGQGLIEAGANAARSIQQGYEAMGRGISSGISSGASAVGAMYKEHKTTVAENKAAANMYQDLRDSNLLPESLTSRIDAQISTKDGWYAKATPSERNKFWKEFDPYFKASIANQYAIDRINAESTQRVKGDILRGAISGGGSAPSAAPAVPSQGTSFNANDMGLPQGESTPGQTASPFISPEAARSLEDNRKRREQRYQQNMFSGYID